MRRMALMGLIAVTVGLIGWTALEPRTNEAEGVHAERTKAPGLEGQVQPSQERRGTDRLEIVAGPATPADNRDASQRVDDVLADLYDKHDTLLAAGATEAAATVRTQIDRLEAAQQEKLVKEE